MKFSPLQTMVPEQSLVWEATAGPNRLGHSVDENNLDTDIPVIWSLLWNGRMLKNNHLEHI